MGIEPDVKHGDLWRLKLTPASYNATERGLSLVMEFAHGAVSRKDVSYTCLHIREGQ